MPTIKNFSTTRPILDQIPEGTKFKLPFTSGSEIKVTVKPDKLVYRDKQDKKTLDIKVVVK